MAVDMNLMNTTTNQTVNNTNLYWQKLHAYQNNVSAGGWTAGPECAAATGRVGSQLPAITGSGSTRTEQYLNRQKMWALGSTGLGIVIAGLSYAFRKRIHPYQVFGYLAGGGCGAFAVYKLWPVVFGKWLDLDRDTKLNETRALFAGDPSRITDHITYLEDRTIIDQYGNKRHLGLMDIVTRQLYDNRPTFADGDSNRYLRVYELGAAFLDGRQRYETGVGTLAGAYAQAVAGVDRTEAITVQNEEWQRSRDASLHRLRDNMADGVARRNDNWVGTITQGVRAFDGAATAYSQVNSHLRQHRNQQKFNAQRAPAQRVHEDGERQLHVRFNSFRDDINRAFTEIT